jgi:tryptophanyl-tRNA synthetase
VPVGEDQQQHLELARDIAGAVNRKFNRNVFKLPEALIQGATTRVMSLKDGLKKMSKSDPSDLSRINLSDSSDQIYQKIKKAKTDNIAEISYDPNLRPEISNLIDIYSALTNISIEDIINHYRTAGFAKFKNELAEIIISNLSPITSKYNELMHNQDYIHSILKNGSEQARLNASKTISKVKELFGFID